MTKTLAKTLSSYAFTFLAVISMPSSAGVVDFESTGQSGACGDIFSSTQSNGFTFTSGHHHICDSTRTDIVANGSNFLLTEMSQTINMTKTGGGTFTLNSFDAVENSLLSYTTGSYMRVVGVLLGGGSTTQTFSFDRLFDGPGGVADFQTFALDGAFTNLMSVSFTALNANFGATASFGLDNLTFDATTTQIPEPGSIALLSLGLAGLGAMRRKQKVA